MNMDVKPSDFGIGHFLEPEEINQLTVAEYNVYERKLKAYRDWKNTIAAEKKISWEEGYEKGIEESRKEKRKAIEMARRMKAKNYPIDEIIELTDLAEEEINQLCESGVKREL